MFLSSLMSSLFGAGRTNVNKAPISNTAECTTDGNSEPQKPALSLEQEIEVLAQHVGGIASGMTIEIDLRELLDLLERKRRKADSYYQLKKHLKEDYGVELIITSRTSKKEEENDKND